jgi:hypothetical protein
VTDVVQLAAAMEATRSGLVPLDFAQLDRGPAWLDLLLPTPSDVGAFFAVTGVPVADELIERFCAPDESSTRRSAHAAGCACVWTFGASSSDSRDLQFEVDLQPVRLLVAGDLVLTHRLAGRRFSIDPPDSPTDGPALAASRLQSTVEQEWHAKAADGQPDAHLLFLAIVRAIVNTLYETRAQLAQRRTQIDFEFFGDLAAARAAAAADAPTVDAVSQLARRGTLLVDTARLRLNCVHTVAAELREWFDDLKPPGREDARIWLDTTERVDEAAEIVKRIYRVRNDLGALRRDVHASMVLLASADTGGQLLAVRALLDRTESARRAGIVAGVLTVLLAGTGLIAAIATIPSAGTYLPMGRAAALTGLVLLASIALGAFVALAASSRSGPMRGATRLGGFIYLIAITAFAFGLIGPSRSRTVVVALGASLSVAAMLLAAIAGDFGGSAGHPLVAAIDRALGTHDELRTDLTSLHSKLEAIATRAERWNHHWPRTPQALGDQLGREHLPLGTRGIEIALGSDGRVTLWRSR